MDRECEIEGCDRAHMSRGWCGTHYMRWRRTGSPLTVRRQIGLPDAERFWQYVVKADDCWTWTGARSHTYGNFFLRRPDGSYRQVQAHRFAYTLVNGAIPDGLTIDHACHTAVADDCRDALTCPHRLCVRPDHLIAMEGAANTQVGGNTIKSSCKHGHEFTPENTGSHGPGGRYRYCRACKRAAQARLRERRRTA